MALGSEDRDRLDRPAAWPALATLVVVVLVWLAAPRVLPTLIGAVDASIYAALEALFSGLAFAGVVWTVLLQSRELALQRAELIATREEMARARAESARTASAQEDAARLAALVALVAHEGEQMKALYKEAFDVVHDEQGRIVDVDPINDEIAARARASDQRRRQLLEELEATHRRLAARSERDLAG